MASLRLNEKVAWISGGSSGIGKAAVQLFINEGANVAYVSQHMAEESAEPSCDSLLAIQCDVADEQQVAASITRTAERFGQLDIIVNNAGIVDVRRLHEYDAAGFDRVMNVNVKAAFYSFKYAYEHLRKQSRSSIVNVGSISSFVGQAATPVYTTSKHALLGLTRSIAIDYAVEGIRCNCVCPGITDTRMLRQHLHDVGNPEQALRERLRRVPINRALQPEEVARTILYLACEDSAGVTGTTVVVDGGYLSTAEWDASKGILD
jgi:NAD(P)-dependent dehydrogenase (short-subunit alcohol dehydrogenase family)